MIIDTLPLIFISIAALFVLFLILPGLVGWRICALCAGVSVTWAGLLMFYWLGQFQNIILVAPLLGASIVGLYYLVEKRAKERLHTFRLPFFLTLLFIAYLLLGVVERYFELLLFLTVLWGIFGAVYVYRENPKVNKLAARIIECCKNW